MARWRNRLGPAVSNDVYADVVGFRLYAKKKGPNRFEWKIVGMKEWEPYRYAEGKSSSLALAKNAALNRMQGIINKASKTIDGLWMHS